MRQGTAPTTRHTEHATRIGAPPDAVYRIVADVTSWPVHFPPTVHAVRLSGDDRAERIRIWALANGAPPPLPHEDADIRAEVALVDETCTLEPGTQGAELTVTLKAADPVAARAAAEQIAARLAPRLRKGIAFRLG